LPSEREADHQLRGLNSCSFQRPVRAGEKIFGGARAFRFASLRGVKPKCRAGFCPQIERENAAKPVLPSPNGNLALLSSKALTIAGNVAGVSISFREIFEPRITPTEIST